MLEHASLRLCGMVRNIGPAASSIDFGANFVGAFHPDQEVIVAHHEISDRTSYFVWARHENLNGNIAAVKINTAIGADKLGHLQPHTQRTASTFAPRTKSGQGESFQIGDRTVHRFRKACPCAASDDAGEVIDSPARHHRFDGFRSRRRG